MYRSVMKQFKYKVFVSGMDNGFNKKIKIK